MLLLAAVGCARQTPSASQVQGLGPIAAGAPSQKLPTPFALPALPLGHASPAKADATPPLQLTSSDGAGLELRSLDVRAVVDGPLVLTELRATFHNPENRVREGRFQLVLPDGAALSRFAMLQPAGWMEGEVVEKAKAERVYEDFLHRRQDPALLQQDAGNTFSARVFPIPAGGDKSFILTWSEELADPRTPWRLPLRGLPKLAEFKARIYLHSAQKPGADVGSLGATLGQVQVIQVDKKDWQPDDDLRVDSQAAGPQPAAMRAGQMVAARVQIPQAAAGKAQPMGKVVVLVDTSASMALAWQGLLTAVDQTLALLDQSGATDVAILAFDQQVAEICQGKTSDCRKLAQAKLQERGPLGASDLAMALGAAGQAAAKLGGAHVRVLLLSDGMASAGRVEGPELAEAVKALAGHGVTRLDALTVTVARDRELLKTLTIAGLPRDGQVVDASRTAELAQLTAETLGAIAVQVPGASWVWPKELRGMQPGQPALIFAELPEALPLSVALSGAASVTVALEAKQGAVPLLERAWVGARIRLLLNRSAEGDRDLAAAFKQQATALSIKHRVLCPTTALLVLETEGDYLRYGIDRTALAQILTVSAEGAAVLEARAAPALGDAWRDQPPPQEQRMWRGRGLGERDEGPVARKMEPDRASAAVDAALADLPATKLAADLGSEGLQDNRGAVVLDKTAGGMGFRGTGSGGGGGEGYGMRRLGRVEALSGGGAAWKDRSAVGFFDGAAQAEFRVVVSKVSGPGDVAAYQRWLDRNRAKLRACFVDQPGVRVQGKLTLSPQGLVTAVEWRRMNPQLGACIEGVLRRLSPAPTADAPVVLAVTLTYAPGRHAPGPLEIAAPQPPPPSMADSREMLEFIAKVRDQPAVTGELAAIRAQLAKKDAVGALKAALAWRAKAPAEPLPLVALGEALLANQDPAGAARAYGSLIDLYPQRADLRRFAGNLLETTGPAGLALAIDTYAKAVAQRPDHPSGAVMLALAQARAGDLDAADATLAKVEPGKWRAGNFSGVERGIASLRALFAVARAAKAPVAGQPDAFPPATASLPVGEAPTLAIVTWETDANDVDSHFFDGRGRHGSYSNKVIPGAELYHDITTGYGPEFVAVRADAAWPLQFFAHYYRMGPMGWGMGRLALIHWDGKALSFDSRPFVLMIDAAHVDLGQIRK
jgi:tetratricopeptide (TPR) repeat protein